MPWYNDYTNDTSIDRPQIRLLDGTLIVSPSDIMLAAQGWEFREFSMKPGGEAFLAALQAIHAGD